MTPTDPRPARLPILLGGERFEALREGLLFHPDSESLIVADMHLEKASAFALHGQSLPPYDSQATLKMLVHAVFLHRPQRLISLGDGFHDARGAARLSPPARTLLEQLRQMTQLVWVVGNHDPDPGAYFTDPVLAELSLGAVRLRHALDPAETGAEISGHYHPKATARVPGGTARCRCFVSDGQRLILPAFGVLTGGLNVLGEVIRPRLGPELTAFLTSGRGLYCFPERALLPPGGRPRRVQRNGMAVSVARRGPS